MTLRKEDIELINKLTNQGTEESARLDDVRGYENILRTSSQWKVPARNTPDFSGVARRIDPMPAVLLQPGSTKINWLIAAVVSALILVSGWFFQANKEVEIAVPFALMQTVWLLDSSKVVLNAGAKLTYSRTKWSAGNRLVDLDGVAYFEVKKGSRFVVTTVHGQVEVLGTSFNVKALKEGFIVECITGKVAVTGSGDQASHELTPGFKTQKDKTSNLLIPDSFDPDRGKEWMTGVFDFKNQSLDEVWAEFKRQFDIEIVHSGLEHRFYTGTFSNKDMTKALMAICKPMGLEFEINESKNLITINN